MDWVLAFLFSLPPTFVRPSSGSLSAQPRSIQVFGVSSAPFLLFTALCMHNRSGYRV